jgi:hypothetical protein
VRVGKTVHHEVKDAPGVFVRHDGMDKRPSGSIGQYKPCHSRKLVGVVMLMIVVVAMIMAVTVVVLMVMVVVVMVFVVLGTVVV